MIRFKHFLFLKSRFWGWRGKQGSQLPAPISQAGFNTTAGNKLENPYPPTSFSEREAGPLPHPGWESTDKCRKGLLLREATASEVVALRVGFGGGSGLLSIVSLFYFLKSWHVNAENTSLCWLRNNYKANTCCVPSLVTFKKKKSTCTHYWL